MNFVAIVCALIALICGAYMFYLASSMLGLYALADFIPFILVLILQSIKSRLRAWANILSVVVTLIAVAWTVATMTGH